MRILGIWWCILSSLLPTAIQALDALEHSHHHHAEICEEGGLHMHAHVAHCQAHPWPSFAHVFSFEILRPNLGSVVFTPLVTGHSNDLFEGTLVFRNVRGPPSGLPLGHQLCT